MAARPGVKAGGEVLFVGKGRLPCYNGRMDDINTLASGRGFTGNLIGYVVPRRGV